MQEKGSLTAEPGQLNKTNGMQGKGLGELLFEARRNFLDYEVEIVEGLNFNHYELLKTFNYYLNSRFETGDQNDDGSERFFHNIISHRCSQTTKNIDLDTKDMYLKSKGEKGYAASIILRAVMQKWMRETNFADLLNLLAERLPQMGAVVWKRCMRSSEEEHYPETSFIEDVSLLELIFDPSVKRLKDSQLVAQRVLMGVQDVMRKAKDGVWDMDACKAVIAAQSGNVRRSKYIQDVSTADIGAFSLTDTIPTIELYEMHGWVPETSLPEAFLKELGIKPDEADSLEYHYIKAILDVPLSEGNKMTNSILYIEELEPDDFPFLDCLLPTRLTNRWLPRSITEALMALQVRMNELVNRFFQALRSGSLHIFQSRGSGPVNNLLQDAQDGDVIITRHPIEPVAMELRAFNQYQTEITNIERQADLIANTMDIVTGEALPTNTPYRLGAQLSASAAKVTELVREQCGIFLSQVFNAWILPDLIESIDEDDIIEIAGSAEELKFIDEAIRKAKVYDAVKTYVLSSNYLPKKEELDLVEKAISEEISSAKDKKLRIDGKFIKKYLNDQMEYQLVFDVTGENTNKKVEDEMLGNLFQIVASNPAVLQDENARSLFRTIAENSGVSPITLSALNKAPAAAAPAQAAPPASAAFAANPGDAAPGGGAPVAG